MLDFYRAVLPAEGYYALFDGVRKAHVWAESLDELTRKTEARIDAPSLYFATCSFHEPTSREAANALYRRALCFDIDAGAEKYAKHGDEVYPTQREAMADLMRWIREAGIKPSLLVSSGEGLHVYFRLTADVAIADWLPVAKGLKAMAQAMALRIDATVTADVVRILRPPGTLHHNGRRVQVLNHNTTEYELADLAHRVALYIPKPREPKPASSLNQSLLGFTAGPPKSAAKIAEHCQAFGHAVSMRGDIAEPYWRAMLGIFKFTEDGEAQAHVASEGHPDYDYGQTQAKLDRWTAGPTTCEHFASHNPSACAGCKFNGKIKSPIQLGELNDRELEQRPLAAPTATDESEPVQQEGLGWTEAETVAAVVPQRPWHDKLPEGFHVRSAQRGYQMVREIHIKVADPTNEAATITKPIEAQFAAVPFWFESWASGEHDGDQAQATYCVFNPARGTVHRYTLPTKAVAQRESLLGALAAQNVQVFPSTQSNKQHMEDFVKASLERMRIAGMRQKILDRFGSMHTPDGELIVAQGRHLINADGSVTEAVVNEKLKTQARAYSVPLPPTGGDTWSREDVVRTCLPLARQHVEYLREFYGSTNFMPYQLAIMLAWASPMMAFMQGSFQSGQDLPGLGLTVTLYSTKSGIGKTAAIHAAALAFGIPNALALQLDRQSSTDLARQMRVLQSGTLPCFMDEMEDVAPVEIASLVSAVGNGSSRQRLDGRTMQITGGTRLALINLMTTNKSHRELIAADRSESTAVQMRLLEIDCTAVQPVNPVVAAKESQARSEILRCAGAVGALLHIAMCGMGSAKLNKLGLLMAERARAAVGGEQDGRILWRALGAMMAVRAILKGLGLEVFDDEALAKEFKIWHDSSYSFSSERLMPTDPSALVSMMLTDLLPSTVFTRRESDKRTKDFKPDMIINDRVPNDVAARVVLEGNYAYVRLDAIREWAFLKRISPRALTEGGVAMGVLKPFLIRGDATKPKLHTPVDLMKGTIYSTGARVPSVRIDLTKLSDGLGYDDAVAAVTGQTVAAQPAAAGAE